MKKFSAKRLGYIFALSDTVYFHWTHLWQILFSASFSTVGFGVFAITTLWLCHELATSCINCIAWLDHLCSRMVLSSMMLSGSMFREKASFSSVYHVTIYEITVLFLPVKQSCSGDMFWLRRLYFGKTGNCNLINCNEINLWKLSFLKHITAQYRMGAKTVQSHIIICSTELLRYLHDYNCTYVYHNTVTEFLFCLFIGTKISKTKTVNVRD